MDTFERDAARMLAVSYNAYMEYMGKPDCDKAARFWGRMLAEAQRKTGIEILSTVSLLYADDKASIEARAAARAHAARNPDTVAFDAGDGDGGALVPAPVPAPRKPSPGVALQASAWLASRRPLPTEAEGARWRREHGE
jgi:hypothetical protein